MFGRLTEYSVTSCASDHSPSGAPPSFGADAVTAPRTKGNGAGDSSVSTCPSSASLSDAGGRTASEIDCATGHGGSEGERTSTSDALKLRRQSFDIEDPLMLAERPLAVSDGRLTSSQATFNLANILIGVGVLNVPFALKQSGYLALLLILLVILVTKTTGKWLGSSLDMIADDALVAQKPMTAWDYGCLAEVCVGPRFSSFINIVTVLEVWLALVAFMVLNGGNAAVIWPDAGRALTVPITGVVATLCIFVPPRVFACLSLVATCAMVVAAMAMVYVITALDDWALPGLDDVVVSFENIPRSVGIIIFCFAGHPCFPSVRASMQKPTKWGCSIDASFVLAFMYYVCFGLLGYIVFGDGLRQSVVQNLAHVHGAMLGRVIAAGCFLIKVQLTFPLLLNAVIVAVWPPSSDGPIWPPLRIALAMAVAAVTVLVAVALRDKVAVVASLTGSLLVTITSILFPAMVHWTLSRRYTEQAIPWSKLAQYMFVLCFGVVFAVLGTAMAVKDILN